jgi:uncharacterized protein (TIGR03435 family)
MLKLLAVMVVVTGLGAAQTPALKEPKELSFNQNTLRELIRAAYHVLDYQISGGPAWIDTDRYNFRVKTTEPRGFEPWRKPLRPLQDVLSDKFSLRLHRETRDLEVFNLSVSKTGGELHRSRVQHCPPFLIGPGVLKPGERPADCSGVLTGPNLQLNETLDVAGMSITGPYSLREHIESELRRIVIDKTGLIALFDIVLEWNREATKQRLKGPIKEDPDSPSLFEALEQQLGLKLEATKGPLEVLVIDNAEKPSER